MEQTLVVLILACISWLAYIIFGDRIFATQYPFDFNEWMNKQDRGPMYKHSDWPKFLPSIRCKDGFKMSVQASETHYCSPRVNYAPSYESVEVGFPTRREPLLMPYAETPEHPTDTVYGWVPVEVINKVVDKHGGIATPLTSTEGLENL